MTTNQGAEFGWEDEIKEDGPDFILLPEGDYFFTVEKMERARFQGSNKMPACNQAKLTLTVHSQEHGDQTIFHNLFLHSKTEGLLSNFFVGIGQKKKGEAVRMNWNAVIGSKGKAHIVINKYLSNGEERANNQVKKFYPYDEAFPNGQGQQQAPPVQQQQTQQQYQAPFPGQTGQTQQPQQNNNQGGGYTPGQF